MITASQFITFFLSLFPSFYKMESFACCMSGREQAGVATSSVAPCFKRALQYRVMALTLKLPFFIIIHL